MAINTKFVIIANTFILRLHSLYAFIVIIAGVMVVHGVPKTKSDIALFLAYVILGYNNPVVSKMKERSNESDSVNASNR